MTFEEEKLALALSTLRATEKRCMSDSTNSGVANSGQTWSVPSFSNLQQNLVRSSTRFWRFSHSSSSQNLSNDNRLNNPSTTTAEQMVSELCTNTN